MTMQLMLRNARLRAAVLAALASVPAIAIACGEATAETPVAPEPAADLPADPEASADPPADPTGDPPAPAPVVAPPPASREALRDRRVHLDLVALAHLADVDHHGLYVDLGTPARLHHTMGRWHGGWLRDVRAGERDFTRIGPDARLFVTLERAGSGTIRVRGRAVGARAIEVYANGQRAGQVAFAGEGVEDHDVQVTNLVAGENVIMLRSGPTREVDGEQVTAEIDSIRVVSGAIAQGEFHAPLFREMVREERLGDDARRAVIARAPATLRWYAEVPPGGALSVAIGSPAEGAHARVAITPEGGSETVLLDAPASSQWQDHVLPLSRWAGQVVRIELAARGQGEVAFAGPAVVVPMPERALEPVRSESVVVLLIDTLRASKLRAYNPGSRVRTPALDAFAREAAVFEHAQAPENWTKPSVASILTSLTPATHNTKEQGSSLPASALMVSEVFDAQGFATAAFLANGYVSDRFGFRQGWDHYTNYIREERNTEAGNVFREAGDWIEQHRNERFFAYIHTIDPHVPYDPPDEFLRMYDPEAYTGRVSPRRTGLQLEEAKRDPAGYFTARDRQRLEALHDGEISYHDREMARFVERLRALGLYDRILFVVTSDHGEEFFEHGSFGHGHSIFQELLHVPLMMRWPENIPASRIAPTVSTMDIAPTIVEAAGLEIPEVFEGRSLLASARGVMRPGPAIAFSDKLDDRRVATAAGYKLVVRGNLTSSFFDLRRDPGEQTQIDDPQRHPIALRYLRVMMGQYLGASDRGEWLTGDALGPSRVLPQASSAVDAELCRQLRMLGYLDARCDAL